MPVHKVLFWSGFGIAVRLWQLGIEMRPFFNRESLWVYPLFATVGGSFGYWLEGVESRQLKMLADRKEMLLEKRRRRAEREAGEPGLSKIEEGGMLASTS
ncbi:NADH-ubiquinone oxidoreductase 14 kDa subunit [Coccidioides immitis RS]|uniref:NADH-ubiquinone oxidoreductase 14 kDa subunit n=7 Tax=Coccidioides TaxID=5500 RepID=J3K1F6_COCIM|nr:NADH-ubiquinone oxidoreductase 14 kDa subunit [Coccidioides immitis RS]XP_003067009.1 NADH2 dehydrogenase 14K chain, putative [Coccidioides posadasii C735 delta SOWgp]EFW21216.1 NADH-ubiquinone oxidoreductase 14 kDa subunit [Coccidioides posadasii str. Silveira]KMM71623.1 NADH2 dehydrogenase 14K chain [Coccidioides posadasii RMSCC 3488]KMP08591.1 NADH2 dehydrogenase 14K chain [Coccidioides immitis RMSCC 2394]KMU78592.1 NADH2 dehydrogenase 14K chain [Coccidioides immitis RMSCC 3703]KMU87407|eukprot:XP_003067009.1 NADH2 dehydrogenase 14K chain, putative [Coccidioides posadasii C735 delta SOWgp]